jgi:hypothetical protein
MGTPSLLCTMGTAVRLSFPFFSHRLLWVRARSVYTDTISVVPTHSASPPSQSADSAFDDGAGAQRSAISPLRSTTDARLTRRTSPGGTVAKFAGQNVHRRLVKEEAYRRQDWHEAMKRAFLGTDEDLLAGASSSFASPAAAFFNGSPRSATHQRPVRVHRRRDTRHEGP